MKAVVMAGGAGTRLRPMTMTVPKPLLPVVNRPLLEHVLRLLRRHGFTDTVVTAHFLGSMVRAYFGSGDDLDMDLTYATQEKPLGTAGSVRNAKLARPASICTPRGPSVHARPVAANPIGVLPTRAPKPMTCEGRDKPGRAGFGACTTCAVVAAESATEDPRRATGLAVTGRV